MDDTKIADWDEISREELMQPDVRNALVYMHRRFNRTPDLAGNSSQPNDQRTAGQDSDE